MIHTSKSPQTLFYVEMTDTFGGEANYSWVNRFIVKASTMRGAISKVTRDTGVHANIDYSTGDMSRYNAKHGAMCYFVSHSDGSEADNYSRIVTL